MLGVADGQTPAVGAAERHGVRRWQPQQVDPLLGIAGVLLLAFDQMLRTQLQGGAAPVARLPAVGEDDAARHQGRAA